MGLIGLLISVLIIILGMGYYLFGTSGSSWSFTKSDDVPAPIVQELSRAQGALQAARDVKSLVEQKAAETMKETGEPTTDNQPPTTAVDRPATENSQPAHFPSSTGSDSGKQSTENEEQTTGNSQQKTENGDKSTVNSEQKTVGKLTIVDRLVDFGFSPGPATRKIDTIVLHSSYNSTGGDVYSVDKVIGIWKSYGVAPHYLIDRSGKIYRLVRDRDIAYHAGVSEMPDGRKNVNDFSLGIELLNTKDGTYTDAQYATVNDLIASLKGKYPIKNVVGHQDIAPDRKDDPWNLEWKRVK